MAAQTGDKLEKACENMNSDASFGAAALFIALCRGCSDEKGEEESFAFMSAKKSETIQLPFTIRTPRKTHTHTHLGTSPKTSIHTCTYTHTYPFILLPPTIPAAIICFVYILFLFLVMSEIPS